jgi:hypothetical protein
VDRVIVCCSGEDVTLYFASAIRCDPAFASCPVELSPLMVIRDAMA